MGKMILVTGGTRCGKSIFAEKLVSEIGDSVLYIATSLPKESDVQVCIETYHKKIPKNWDVLEAYRNFDELLEDVGAAYDAIMLDCMTIMVMNIMLEDFDVDYDTIPVSKVLQIEKHVIYEIEKIAYIAKKIPHPIVIVTKELSMGMPSFDRYSNIYRDIVGKVNQILAQNADEVYLLVCGIPVKIK